MRSVVLFSLLVVAGCANSTGPAATADAERVELQIPAPAANTRDSIHETIARSSIPVGVFAVSMTSSSRHGCSRSWQMTSTQAKAKLQLDSDVATLEVERETTTTSGSFGVRGEPSRWTSKTQAKLRGSFTELEPGKLQASLSQVSCEGECDSGSVELICELRKIPLDERAPSGERTDEAALGGTIEGVVCTGADSLLGRYTPGELPFAPGAGVEVDRDEYGYGEGSSKTYRAIAAVTP
ncbi:MAG: hypothetical protein HOV80_27885 [Polyangiaceae bacterium]|nr:hypothetical protein [Polyangiaceae bacterium]